MVSGLQGCWFLGGLDQSCNDVCGDQGLTYSELTKTAGSDGSNANCFNVLDTLGAPREVRCDGNTARDDGVQEVVAGGRGCFFADKTNQSVCINFPTFNDKIDWVRDASVTTAGASNVISARACACE